MLLSVVQESKVEASAADTRLVTNTVFRALVKMYAAIYAPAKLAWLAFMHPGVSRHYRPPPLLPLHAPDRLAMVHCTNLVGTRHRSRVKVSTVLRRRICRAARDGRRRGQLWLLLLGRVDSLGLRVAGLSGSRR